MRCYRQPVLVAAIIGISVSTVLAAVLTEAAVKTYVEYLDRARQAFVSRVNQPVFGSAPDRTSLGRTETIVRPGAGDGIQTMPDSLIHHWRGTVFVPGVTLDQSLSVSRAYRDYPKIFRPVIASTVLSNEGDAFRVQFRIKQSAGGLTATLDMWSSIRYVKSDATHAYVLSSSDTIREVKDAGRS